MDQILSIDPNNFNPRSKTDAIVLGKFSQFSLFFTFQFFKIQFASFHSNSLIFLLFLGCGLGRDPQIWNVIDQITQNQFFMSDTPLIIDGDGINWLIDRWNKFPKVLPYSTDIVLTPNEREFKRLVDLFEISSENNNQDNISNGKEEFENDYKKIEKLKELSHKLDSIIMLKGQNDIIVNQSGKILIGHEKSSPKRCGGQGDLLAGCLGTWLTWAIKKRKSLFHQSKIQNNNNDNYENNYKVIISPSHDIDSNNNLNEIEHDERMLACLAASMTIKRAGFMAYKDYSRSTIASDIISYIHSSFTELFVD